MDIRADLDSGGKLGVHRCKEKNNAHEMQFMFRFSFEIPLSTALLLDL